MNRLVDHPSSPRRQARWLAAATLCSVMALTGCATTEKSAGALSASDKAQAAIQDPALRNAAVESTKTQDYVAAAAYWGTLYERDPDNGDVAVNYSRALRQIGSVGQALNVMQRTHTTNTENADVLAEFGKVLAASGRADQAAAMLEASARIKPKDWTVQSALGVSLDQMGRYDEAKLHYEEALALSPGNPSVLTNLGLSYALTGDLDMAERTLRKAVADARADARARQNLAIVLGLKGNFEEAERLARADLPANVADSNIAYLRDMLSQPALWKQMETLDAPAAPAKTAPTSSLPAAEKPVGSIRQAPPAADTEKVSSMPPETRTSIY
jgi:Flp pilus assembly protein TadD